MLRIRKSLIGRLPRPILVSCRRTCFSALLTARKAVRGYFALKVVPSRPLLLGLVVMLFLVAALFALGSGLYEWIIGAVFFSAELPSDYSMQCGTLLCKHLHRLGSCPGSVRLTGYCRQPRLLLVGSSRTCCCLSHVSLEQAHAGT